MKTDNKKMPRALSQELGIKLSEWTHNVTSYFDFCDNKQEELFAIIRSPETLILSTLAMKKTLYTMCFRICFPCRLSY